MAQAARLTVEGNALELPVVVGTEGEHAVDISKLRAKTGYITLDEGYMNTGSTTQCHHVSRRRAGHPPLSRLPDRAAGRELRLHRSRVPAALRRAADARRSSKTFASKLRRHTMLHEDMRLFYDGFPRDAHPMAIFSSVCGRSPRSIRIRSARTIRSRSTCRSCG